MHYYPQDHREYLKNELIKRVQRRPQYSLRAFARDLELSPSTLSDFLNNKLCISDERIRHLSKKISLKEDHQSHWLDLVKLKFSKDKSQLNLAKIRISERLEKNGGKLSLHRFKTLTTWYYLCVYHLIQMHPRFQDLSVCAKTLEITVEEVKQATQSLLQIGLLEKNESLFVAKEDFVLVGENTPSEHIRQFHTEFIGKAQVALAEQGIETRENSTSLITIKKSDLKKIKAEIHNFADQILSKYGNHADSDDLYCLSMQLFSLTEADSYEN